MKLTFSNNVCMLGVFQTVTKNVCISLTAMFKKFLNITNRKILHVDVTAIHHVGH